MATCSTNEFKSGLKLLLDGDPYHILENEFVKPGKGQAFNRVKLRNLKNGRVLERTFKSGEQFELADVLEMEVNFLYSDGALWHFMHPETYEQYSAAEPAVGDNAKWLHEQAACSLILWNEVPLSVTPPNFVEMKITETDPGLRGDTAQGGTKRAVLESGAVIKVPLFAEPGDLVRVDTRTGDYVSRVKG